MTELRVYATGAIDAIPAILYWGLLLVFVVGLVILLWRKGIKEGLRYSALLLLAEWGIVILGIAVVFREACAERRINLIPLWSYFDYGTNSYLMEMAAINILNIVLFIPVGFLLGCAFRQMTWRRALAVGAGMSASIEVLQLIFKRGLCETDDVIHNVVGCMIGYGIVAVWRQIAKKMQKGMIFPFYDFHFMEKFGSFADD